MNPEPQPSFAWWLALAAATLAWAFTARARVAFRSLSPVTLEALVERLGEPGAEFLRKSLRGPTAFWFTLHLVNALALLAFLTVLLAGAPPIRAGGLAFELHPVGRVGHDAVLFAALALLVLCVEFLVPVLTTRGDRARVVVRSLPVIRAAHRVLSPLTSTLARWTTDEADDSDEESSAAAEEVDAFIDVGTREGILEEGEGEMLRNLVTFGDTRVREVLTPRTDIVAIEQDATIRDLVRLMARSRFSRIPVHGGQLDDILGIVTLKDAVAAFQGGRAEAPVTELMRRPLIVPESKRVAELLRELQAGRQQVAVVVDEYGGTAGLVTIEDLLEELVGEIREEHEEGEDIFRLADGAWQVRGRALLHDVGAVLGTEMDDAESDTVGGLMLARFERVPRKGEHVDWLGWRFTVDEADRKRVQLVHVTPAPPADADLPARATPGVEPVPGEAAS